VITFVKYFFILLLHAAAVKLLASLQITARAASAHSLSGFSSPPRDWEDVFPEGEEGREQMTRKKHKKKKKKVWGVKEPPKAHKTIATGSKKPFKQKLPSCFNNKETELKVSNRISFIPAELSDLFVII
jgi:hypothetical protein